MVLERFHVWEFQYVSRFLESCIGRQICSLFLLSTIHATVIHVRTLAFGVLSLSAGRGFRADSDL